VKIQLHAFLTSTLDGCEWSTSNLAASSLEKEPLVVSEQEAEWTKELVLIW
jgi:hypothetical protein